MNFNEEKHNGQSTSIHEADDEQGSVRFTQLEDRSRWKRFTDSFKPADLGDHGRSEGMTDLERAAIKTSQAPLSRDLKSRHIQMIAIGGSIGTGLFVGSGATLSEGGPASYVYIAIGVPE